MTLNLEELVFNEWPYHDDNYGHTLEALERARMLQGSSDKSLFSISKLRKATVHYYVKKDNLNFDS
jgi:hypothetical protein